MNTLKIKQQYLLKAFPTHSICVLVCLTYVGIIVLFSIWVSPIADSVREYFTACLQGVTIKLNISSW